jgi:hypothetical protein
MTLIAQRSTGFDVSTEGLGTVTKKLWLGYVYLFMQLVNAGIYKSEHRFVLVLLWLQARFI